MKKEDKEDKLQETLDYFENELDNNADYINKELPKKWLIKVKTKTEEEKIKKLGKETNKAADKKKLTKLKEEADYLEEELKENIDYIKREAPKKLLVKPPELNKLIEKRRMILQEIKKTEEELESLEKLRTELERKERSIDTGKHVEDLERIENYIENQLNQIKR